MPQSPHPKGGRGADTVCLLTRQTRGCNTSCRARCSQGSHRPWPPALWSGARSSEQALGTLRSSPGTHQSLPHCCRSVRMKPGLSLRAARRCRQESHSTCLHGEGSLGQGEPPNRPSAWEGGGCQATGAPDAFQELQQQLPAPPTDSDTGSARAELGHVTHSTTAQHLQGITSPRRGFHAGGSLREQPCTEVVGELEMAGDGVGVVLSACPSLLERWE